MNSGPLHCSESNPATEVQPWQEPAIIFERQLLAEAQGGPGPHGAPSGLLGPLSISGQTGSTAVC